MGYETPLIPFCRSEFLQDFSISLGRKLKSIAHASKSIQVELDCYEHEGENLERLTVWIETWNYTRATLALCENRLAWISVALISTVNRAKYKEGFHPQCDPFTPDDLVEALRETVSVSTRLCYNESPLPTLRRIWRHEGDVEVTGKLGKRLTKRSAPKNSTC